MARNINAIGLVLTALCSITYAQGPGVTMAAFKLKIKDVSFSPEQAIATVELRRFALRGPMTGAVTGDFAGVPNREGPATVDLTKGQIELQLHFNPMRILKPGEISKLTV